MQWSDTLFVEKDGAVSQDAGGRGCVRRTDELNFPVYGRRHAGCPETIVNIDDGESWGTAVQHAEQGGITAGPGTI